MTQRKTLLTRQDLKIYATERLTDAPDGGGLMTAQELTGAPGELMPTPSDVDRTQGRFNARSVHAGVRRPDATPLWGAHVIISKPPKASNVSYLLYRGVKYGEVRADIVKRIAAYAVATIESRMTLLSVQSLGSRIIQAYQRPGEPLPLIGDVYCLRQDKRGYPQQEQYIKVIRVSSVARGSQIHSPPRVTGRPASIVPCWMMALPPRLYCTDDCASACQSNSSRQRISAGSSRASLLSLRVSVQAVIAGSFWRR